MLFKASSSFTLRLIFITICGPKLTFSSDVDSDLLKQIDENSLKKLNELKTDDNLLTAVNFGEDLVKKFTRVVSLMPN